MSHEPAVIRLPNFIVVDGPAVNGIGNPAYRGTNRARPFYLDDLPKEHPANQAFLRCLDEIDEEWWVFHEASRAWALADLYNAVDPSLGFEVIEVTEGAEPSRTQGLRLGLDLSRGFYNSLLWWGLDLKAIGGRYPGVQGFRDQLNRHGLFDDLSTACECLALLLRIQHEIPGALEGDDLAGFRPVTLYLAPSMSAR